MPVFRQNKGSRTASKKAGDELLLKEKNGIKKWENKRKKRFEETREEGRAKRKRYEGTGQASLQASTRGRKQRVTKKSGWMGSHGVEVKKMKRHQRGGKPKRGKRGVKGYMDHLYKKSKVKDQENRGGAERRRREGSRRGATEEVNLNGVTPTSEGASRRYRRIHRGSRVGGKRTWDKPREKKKKVQKNKKKKKNGQIGWCAKREERGMCGKM